MDQITFKVQRFHPDKDRKPYLQNYSFPLKPAMTVLEGLYYILEYLDHTLSFRSSCRAAVCGSCAMHINGKYRLACNTQISSLKSKTIIVRPLLHLPVFKDLVVDHTDFFENLIALKPWLINKEPAPEKEYIQMPEERNRIGNTIDCILCGACYGACATAGVNKEYFGPAALLKAERFLRDSRDSIKDERLKIVDDLHGVWRCHSIFSCQEVCPKELSPAEAIAKIKKRILKKGGKKG